MPRGVPAGLPTAWSKAALRNAYSGARTSTTTHCCITQLCPYLVNVMPEHLNVQNPLPEVCPHFVSDYSPGVGT